MSALLCVFGTIALANSYTCMLKLSIAEDLASNIDPALNDSYVAIVNSDMYQIATFKDLTYT